MLRKTTLCFALLFFAVTLAIAQENTIVEETSKPKAHRIPFYLVGGVPDNKDASHPVKVLINEAFVVGYSEERQNPVWSAYHVDKIENAPEHDRPNIFYTDLRTEAKVSGEKSFRRQNEPAYDRGHMTPNNAIQEEWGRLAQMETFLMSNISPQISALNSGIWKRLEHDITDRLVKKTDDLWVIAGPIFGNEPATIKDTRIQIPKSFFMILLKHHYSGGYSAIAFVFPNNRDDLQNKELENFLACVSEIESATHLDFFTGLGSEEDFDESKKGNFDSWFGEQ